MKKGIVKYKNLISIISIIFSIILFSLYIVPIKHIHSSFYGDMYFNVFKAINAEYQYVLMSSIISIMIIIPLSIYVLIKKEIKYPLVLSLILVLIIVLALSIATYICAFSLSNNKPK